jgi:hypothetical protein
MELLLFLILLTLIFGADVGGGCLLLIVAVGIIAIISHLLGNFLNNNWGIIQNILEVILGIWLIGILIKKIDTKEKRKKIWGYCIGRWYRIPFIFFGIVVLGILILGVISLHN